MRRRLGGGPASLGGRFTPVMAPIWRELEEQVDGELKKAGSAVVGAWEVGAAELGRALVGEPDDRVLVERFSDALVPTLQPLQDLHKGVAKAMAEGLAVGTRTESIAAAAEPLVGLLQGLDERVADGWEKTTTHLAPLFARCARPDEARERFRAGGRALRQACADADVLWRARLGALPTAPGLWEGLTGAAEGWQLAISRGLEIAIDRHAKGLVAEVRAGRG